MAGCGNRHVSVVWPKISAPARCRKDTAHPIALTQLVLSVVFFSRSNKVPRLTWGVISCCQGVC
jgi:hypothetical protein